MKISVQNTGFYRRLSHPGSLSLVIAVGFFALYLGLLRPGYAVNDDVKMISIMAGYPGNNPAPFLIFSNVLLGIVLMPLYTLPTTVNWEVVFFVAVNLFSVWVLLDVIVSGSPQAYQKLFGIIVVLACDSYFILNISFTTIASFACIAGICSIFTAARSPSPGRNLLIVCGAALILVGSLIRFEMLPFVLSIALPAAVLSYRSFNIKFSVPAMLIVGLPVLMGYIFNVWYLRSAPEWHAYQIYNDTRSLLQDTHRLENTGREIRHIAWTSNDQDLFGRWFFPDKSIYSLEHLQYLVDHVSGTSRDLAGTAKAVIRAIFMPILIPYVLMILSTWLFMLFSGVSKRAALPLLAVGAICLADNLYLAWAWKIADRILLSSFAAATIIGLVLLNWHIQGGPNLPASPSSDIASSRRFPGVPTVSLAIMLVLTFSESFVTSRNNASKQAAYHEILADWLTLQEDGKISRDALIISPANGLPIEWSNPFIIEFPGVPYFDTGWLTFSPFYEQVLREYQIQSLPDAWYQKDNIYLMAKSSFTAGLARYLQTHENISVDFQVVYAMPNTYRIPLYDGRYLYKVIQVK